MAPLSLDGVLRSELQAHLEREIGRFIRTPTIRSASLIRLSIRGAVGKPGFLLVPATALVDDVIMQAGGPAQNADLQRVQVERDNDVLVTSDVMRQALTEGRSVDQLNLRAGDQIVVGARAETSIWKTVGRYAVIIASTVLLGVRAF